MSLKPWADGFRYLEAIGILYGSSIFSFKSAFDLLDFRSLIPAQNWQRLRRMNISTSFRIRERRTQYRYILSLSNNYGVWERACSTIGTLECLQSLCIDITIWNDDDWETKNTIIEDCFYYILEPLKMIKANAIELELNADVPQAARNVLKRYNCRVREFHRPYNEKVCRHAW